MKENILLTPDNTIYLDSSKLLSYKTYKGIIYICIYEIEATENGLVMKILHKTEIAC